MKLHQIVLKCLLNCWCLIKLCFKKNLLNLLSIFPHKKFQNAVINGRGGVWPRQGEKYVHEAWPRILRQFVFLTHLQCDCVCCHPLYSGRQACGRTSRGHTGFLHLPSAVLALLIFLARRTQHRAGYRIPGPKFIRATRSIGYNIRSNLLLTHLHQRNQLISHRIEVRHYQGFKSWNQVTPARPAFHSSRQPLGFFVTADRPQSVMTAPVSPSTMIRVGSTWTPKDSAARRRASSGSYGRRRKSFPATNSSIPASLARTWQQMGMSNQDKGGMTTVYSIERKRCIVRTSNAAAAYQCQYLVRLASTVSQVLYVTPHWHVYAECAREDFFLLSLSWIKSNSSPHSWPHLPTTYYLLIELSQGRFWYRRNRTHKVLHRL